MLPNIILKNFNDFEIIKYSSDFTKNNKSYTHIFNLYTYFLFNCLTEDDFLNLKEQILLNKRLNLNTIKELLFLFLTESLRQKNIEYFHITLESVFLIILFFYDKKILSKEQLSILLHDDNKKTILNEYKYLIYSSDLDNEYRLHLFSQFIFVKNKLLNKKEINNTFNLINVLLEDFKSTNDEKNIYYLFIVINEYKLNILFPNLNSNFMDCFTPSLLKNFTMNEINYFSNFNTKEQYDIMYQKVKQLLEKTQTFDLIFLCSFLLKKSNFSKDLLEKKFITQLQKETLIKTIKKQNTNFQYYEKIFTYTKKEIDYKKKNAEIDDVINTIFEIFSKDYIDSLFSCTDNAISYAICEKEMNNFCIDEEKMLLLKYYKDKDLLLPKRNYVYFMFLIENSINSIKNNFHIPLSYFETIQNVSNIDKQLLKNILNYYYNKDYELFIPLISLMIEKIYTKNKELIQKNNKLSFETTQEFNSKYCKFLLLNQNSNVFRDIILSNKDNFIEYLYEILLGNLYHKLRNKTAHGELTENQINENIADLLYYFFVLITRNIKELDTKNVSIIKYEDCNFYIAQYKLSMLSSQHLSNEIKMQNNDPTIIFFDKNNFINYLKNLPIKNNEIFIHVCSFLYEKIFNNKKEIFDKNTQEKINIANEYMTSIINITSNKID